MVQHKRSDLPDNRVVGRRGLTAMKKAVLFITSMGRFSRRIPDNPQHHARNLMNRGARPSGRYLAAILLLVMLAPGCATIVSDPFYGMTSKNVGTVQIKKVYVVFGKSRFFASFQASVSSRPSIFGLRDRSLPMFMTATSREAGIAQASPAPNGSARSAFKIRPFFLIENHFPVTQVAIVAK